VQTPNILGGVDVGGSLLAKSIQGAIRKLRDSPGWQGAILLCFSEDIGRTNFVSF